MNIAMVGSGSRCLYFMNMLSGYRFSRDMPEVVAICDTHEADSDLGAPTGADIAAIGDYRDFFSRENIDVIVDLTGDAAIHQSLEQGKKPGVVLLDAQQALDMLEERKAREQQDAGALDFARARQLCDLMFHDFTNEEITVLDASHTIVDASNFPLAKYGLKRSDVVGQRCYEVFHHCKTPNDESRHPCPLNQVIRTGEAHRCVHIHYDKDGRKIILSISSYPIFEDGKVAGMVEFARDITWEANLQKSFGEQEKLAAIGRLAAGVAHEINNPLTTILTSSMLVAEDTAPEDPNREELELISQEALRCREIVSNLLDFARQSEPKTVDQDINKIVAEGAALIRKHADFKNIAMQVDLAPEPIQVCCDKSQIIQCLINLGLNAVDATFPGGRIIFTTRPLPDEDMMEIVVRDTGEGLPDKIADKIFEPFFTTKETGTGLGLSITHGFVRQHRGFISVESRPGQGAAFTIRLPVCGREQTPCQPDA